MTTTKTSMIHAAETPNDSRAAFDAYLSDLSSQIPEMSPEHFGSFSNHFTSLLRGGYDSGVPAHELSASLSDEAASWIDGNCTLVSEPWDGDTLADHFDLWMSSDSANIQEDGDALLDVAITVKDSNAPHGPQCKVQGALDEVSALLEDCFYATLLEDVLEHRNIVRLVDEDDLDDLPTWPDAIRIGGWTVHAFGDLLGADEEAETAE